MPKAALVVANGVLPREEIIRSEMAKAAYTLAADGGLGKLLAIGIAPSGVLGDFDSCVGDIPDGIEMISAPDQDATDLEKSVRELIGRGYDPITITGATGGRLDHTFGALGVLCKYALRLVDDHGVALCLRGPGSLALDTAPGQLISLMPCGNVRGVSTTGLKWPLIQEDFNFAERDGTSNAALGDQVEISIRQGCLVVYAHHPR